MAKLRSARYRADSAPRSPDRSNERQVSVAQRASVPARRFPRRARRPSARTRGQRRWPPTRAPFIRRIGNDQTRKSLPRSWRCRRCDHPRVHLELRVDERRHVHDQNARLASQYASASPRRHRWACQVAAGRVEVGCRGQAQDVEDEWLDAVRAYMPVLESGLPRKAALSGGCASVPPVSF